MDRDERIWAEAAIDICTAATRTGVTVLFVRKQDSNDLADMVITNATTPDMVSALTGYQPEVKNE